MAIRPFKIELIKEESDQKVSFGPRQFGEIGRDIMIVKRALGQIIPYSELIEENDEDPSLEREDPNSWFDCITGQISTSREAATFDSNLQNYLMKFQLDNQFYILCYNFIKFNIAETLEKREDFEERRGSIDEPSWKTGGRIVQAVGEFASRGWPAARATILGEFTSDEVMGTMTEEDEQFFMALQIDVMLEMFARDFGTISEATLAVMHGWRPRSSIGNTSYYHDEQVFENEDGAYDLVIRGLWESFINNDLQQKFVLADNDGSIVEPTANQFAEFGRALDAYKGIGAKAKQFLEKYKQQVSSFEDVNIDDDDYYFKSEHFGVLKYAIIPKERKSMLYSAFETASEFDPRELGTHNMSNQDYANATRRAFEPDPLTDPDPFIIDDTLIGHFTTTEYTLSNLPPRQEDDEYREIVSKMEDAALTEILRFYGKPHVWFHKENDPVFQGYYGVNRNPFMSTYHNEEYTDLDNYAITTRTNASIIGSPLTSYDRNNRGEITNRFNEHTRGAYHPYEDMEYSSYQENIIYNSSERPLVQFIEFRTPSLRPGDFYRAKFLINKKKLDFINEGYFHREEEQREEPDARPEEVEQMSPGVITPTCDDTPPSPEMQKRRFQEYKALAAKRRREISRILREKALETYQTEANAASARVDLGVFGNPNLNFGNWQTDSPEFRNTLVDNLGMPIYDYTLGWLADGPQNRGAGSVGKPFGEDTPMSDSFTYEQLGEMLQRASKAIKGAYEKCVKDKVSFKGIEGFNGALESAKLLEVLGDLKRVIRQDPNTKNFNFGSGGFAQTDSAGNTKLTTEGFNPLLATIGTPSSRINIEYAHTSGGLKIKSITAGGALVSNIESKLRPGTSLARPRTVGYLAQVRAMSGRRLFTGDWYKQIGESFFGDADGSCDDLGAGQKGLAFLVKHTLGLSGQLDDANPIHQWYSENFATPASEWLKKNGEGGMFKYDEKFGTDELLGTIGKNCKSIETIFTQFLDKVSLRAILCDIFKCLKLPAVNISIPNFRVPDLPKLPIFGWWWWLIKFMLDRFFEILTRMLCRYAQFILDLLQSPICRDQLIDDLYGTASMATPGVQAALAEGLLEMDIKKKEREASKQLIDEVGLFLTGEELCRLFNGEKLDAATVNMILKVSERLGISSISDEEALTKFFEVISIFIPDGFCENLQQATFIPGRASCEDTADYISQVRRRMLANEATDEEIQQAVDMANTNLMDQAQAFEALADGGISAIVPPAYEFGNENALISTIPGNLKGSSERTAAEIFDAAKTSYLTSLTTYRNSFFLNYNRLPHPNDEKYNEKSAIIVETILENLKLFSTYSKQSAGAVTEGSLHTQLYLLHQVYDLEYYPHLIEERRKLISKVYLKPSDDRTRLPQTAVENFSTVSYDSRSSYDDLEIRDRFFLRPVGYSLDGYMFIDSQTQRPAIVEPIDPQSEEDDDIDYGKVPLSIAEMASPSNYLNSKTSPLSNHGSVGLYKLLKKAISQQDPADVDANSVGQDEAIKFLQQLVNERLNKMQQDLSREMENMFTPLPTEQFLAIIKDKFDASFENTREALAGGLSSEVVNVSRGIGGDAGGYNTMFLTMNLGYSNPTIYLREFPSTATTNQFDPYTIEIMPGSPSNYRARSSLLRGGPVNFTYCDSLPGPGLNRDSATDAQLSESGIYDAAIQGIPSGLYTRREVMSRQYWAPVNQAVDRVFDQPWDLQTDGIMSEKIFLGSFRDNILRNEFYNNQFSSFKEGIFEQMFFALRRSRLFDEEYFDGFIRRVKGRIQVTQDGCYKNRFNISSLGALSFEKIVTDEFPEQLQAELAKPENAPENLDFDDLGPFEKAIQNVCVIGYIRLCIVEFLLKGAIPFSVWDVEGVAEEPLIHDYLYHFVHEELTFRQGQSITKHWKKPIERITGIENSVAALKDVVKKQFLGLIGTSKTIFENPLDIDYYNWFVKYGIPQADVSRKYVVSTSEQISFDSDFAFTSASVDPENSDNLIFDRRQIRDHGRAGANFRIFGRDLGEQGINRPDKFYWSHPLEDSRNIIIDRNYELSGLLPPDTESIHDILLNGGDNFFHIEHYIEVTGPLARLESIVLPVRKIVEDIINLNVEEALANDNLEDNRYITNPTQPRVPQQMNVLSARNRFDQDSIFPVDISSYRISQRPFQPAGEDDGDPLLQSAGSSLESHPVYDEEGNEVSNRGDHNASHEIFNVKDFIQGIRNALSADDIRKYFYHLQMRLTYDPNPDTAPGGSALNTNVQEADGKSEVIRRTPSRFITRKRRIISFKRDLFLNDIDEYAEGESIVNYKNHLYNSVFSGGMLGSGTPTAASSRFFNAFKDFVELTKTDNDRYSVLITNGEDMLRLARVIHEDNLRPVPGGFDYNLRAEEPLGFLDNFYGINIPSNGSGANTETKRPTLVANSLLDANDIDKNTERFYSSGYFYNDMPLATSMKTSAYVEAQKNINPPFMAFAQDRLIHSSIEGNPQEIFKNLYGDFGENEELFEEAKGLMDAGILSNKSYIEETYLETVFNFTDLGSLICGLRSSYNIAETFDRSIYSFEASEELKRTFEGSLKNVLTSLGYEYEQSNTSHFEIDNFKDEKLTQYGRTFFKIKSEDENEIGDIRIARPMGIDPNSNINLTQRVIVKTPWSTCESPENFVSRDGDLVQTDHNDNEHRYTIDSVPEYWNDFKTGVWSQTDINQDNRTVTFGRRKDAVGIGRVEGKFALLENPGGTRPELSKREAFVTSRNVFEVSKNLFEKPTLSFDRDSGKHSLELSSKSNRLAPNLYKIPFRVLLTQIFREDETTPSEVYCKVVPPLYFEPDRTNQELSNIHSKARNSNIGQLNRAVKKIAEEYVRLARSVSSSLIEEGIQEIPEEQLAALEEALRRDPHGDPEGLHFQNNIVLPVDTIRSSPGLSHFPDFTTDFGNGSDARGDSYRSQTDQNLLTNNVDDILKQNKSHLDPGNSRFGGNNGSKPQFCSIERIYSEVFKIETDSESFNSRIELDALFANRGALVKRESSEIKSSIMSAADDKHNDKRSYLESKNYFYTNTRWDSTGPRIELTSDTAFHRMIFSMHNVLNEYMNFRAAGKSSFWGLLTEYREKFYTAIPRAFDREAGPGGDDDRLKTTGTLRQHRDAMATSARRNTPHALLFSRISTKYLEEYSKKFVLNEIGDLNKPHIFDEDIIDFQGKIHEAFRKDSGGAWEPPEHMFFHKLKSVSSVLAGPDPADEEYKHGALNANLLSFGDNTLKNIPAGAFEGMKVRRVLGGLTSRKKVELPVLPGISGVSIDVDIPSGNTPEVFSVNEPGVVMQIPNMQDIIELRSQFYRPYKIEDNLRDNILTNQFCSFKNLLPKNTRQASNGYYFDGTGYNFVNYNQISDCHIDRRYSSMYHCSGKISLVDLSVFIKASIKNVMIRSVTPEQREDVIDTVFREDIDPYDYFKFEPFFRNAENIKIIKQLYNGAGLDTNDRTRINRFEFDDEMFSINRFMEFQGRTQRGISSTLTNDLVDNLESVISSMTYMLGMQMSYKTFNEMNSRKGQTKVKTLAQLMLLQRIVKKLKNDRYAPANTLAILSMISDPIAFDDAMSESFSRKISNTYRESIKDWALACLHFLIIHMARTNFGYGSHQAQWKDAYDFVGYADFSTNFENGMIPYIVFLQSIGVLANSNDEQGYRFHHHRNDTDDDGFLMRLNIADPDDPDEKVAAFWTQSRKRSPKMVSYILGNQFRDSIVQNIDSLSTDSMEKIINFANVFRYQYLMFSINTQTEGHWVHANDRGKQSSVQAMPVLPPGNYGSLSRGVFPNNNSLILQVLREHIIRTDVYRRNQKVPYVGTEEDIAIENSAFYEQAFNKYMDGFLSVSDDERLNEIAGDAVSRIERKKRRHSRNYLTSGQLETIKLGQIENFVSNLDLNLFFNLFLSSTSNENYNSKIEKGRIIDSQNNNIKPGPQYSNAAQSFASIFGFAADSNSPMVEIQAESADFLDNSPLLQKYMIEKYNMGYLADSDNIHARNITPSEVYQDIVKKCLFGSKSALGHLTEKALDSAAFASGQPSYLDQMALGVVEIDRRYRQSFRAFSGISQDVLDASMLDEAFIDGVLVKGLIKSSTIKQGCRLIANVFEGRWDGDPDSISDGIQLNLTDNEGKNVLRGYKTIQNISEEYRTFYMINKKSGNNTFSVPMSKYEYVTSPEGEAYFDECYDLPEYLELYEERRPQLVEHLLEDASTKLVFNYALPVKRYQSVATIFGTDALASYSDMPSVMESPKATLSSIINIASMNRKQRNELFKDVSKSEYFKTMLDDANTNPDGMSCFSNPFDENLFSDWWDMFKELIVLFPAILFRGIANAIDPAYKEMKVHWSACQIKELTFDGMRPWDSTADMNYEDMSAGLWLPGDLSEQERNSGHGRGLYSPIIPQAGIDIVDSFGTIIDSGFTDGYDKLGNTLAKTVGYAYKGPISLVDGLFEFNIPCAGIGPDGSWGDKSFNTGRYGHPVSPFTILALSTRQLPGDKRIRRNSGACSDVIPIPAFPPPEEACPVEDVPPPFGRFNDSED